MKTAAGKFAKGLLPFSIRVRCHRMRRHLHWRLHPLPWALMRGSPDSFPFVLEERSSPLHRAGLAPGTTEGKRTNVSLGAAAVDGLVVRPGEVFSFCRTVGPTTRRRGYAPGLEMHDQQFTKAHGGGLCQLSNLLFGLAVYADAAIVERHRHSFDLFPDTDRSVPFGFGATVFYNHVDFQFRNTLEQPMLLRTWIDSDVLRGQVRLTHDPGWRVRVVEEGHRFFREHGEIFRENRLLRQRINASGEESAPVLLLASKARVLYPAEHLVDS